MQPLRMYKLLYLAQHSKSYIDCLVFELSNIRFIALLINLQYRANKTDV